MGLVNYPDSEGSDDEAQPLPIARESKNFATKSFQKVVDSSNRSKIKVSLPSAVSATSDEKAIESDRPAKKQKTGGLFSGLNSFLPAPKRSGESEGAGHTATEKKLGLGRGLGSGVSLRTGATPGFSRSAPSPFEEQSSETTSDYQAKGYESNMSALSTIAPRELESEFKLIGKSTVFRPLSVARNSQKKKKQKAITAASHSKEKDYMSTEVPSISQEGSQPKTRAKVSLFSMTAREDAIPGPVLEYGIETQSEGHDLGEDQSQYPYEDLPQSAHPIQDAQTLKSIASDLNLDEAAKRQLFGRRGKGNEVPVNLVNFDTDREYNANEELRAAGETVQHKALRTVQPGKHSLRQLVTAASTQKDALEESWAAGRRNKKEAGNKYGW